MKLDQLEHYDWFYDESIFWLDISGLPQAIQDKAREIDGVNFNPKCFGICVGYEMKNGEFFVITDTDFSTGKSCNVFYIDSDGDKHWFQTELPQDFLKQMFAECAKVVADHNSKQKASVRDALQKAGKKAATHPARAAKKLTDKESR